MIDQEAKQIIDNSVSSFKIEDYPQIEKLDKKTGETKKYYVVPDDLFDLHLKELPEGTYNESKTYRAYNNGKLYQLNQDPEEAANRGRLGGLSCQSTLKARRTFKEQIDIILSNIDTENGKTGLENVAVAMYERALAGDTKAAQFLRDTAGEKPAESLDLNANIMTEADKALIDKLKIRMQDHT